MDGQEQLLEAQWEREGEEGEERKKTQTNKCKKLGKQNKKKDKQRPRATTDLDLRLVRQPQKVGRSEVEEVGAVRTNGTTGCTEKKGEQQTGLCVSGTDPRIREFECDSSWRISELCCKFLTIPRRISSCSLVAWQGTAALASNQRSTPPPPTNKHTQTHKMRRP